jgi:hypothetical protein
MFALPTGLDQQAAQLWLGQLPGQRGGRSRGQDRAGIRASESRLGLPEGSQCGGTVLAQHRPQLVGELLPAPGRVLTGAGQHRDRLCQLSVVGKLAMSVGVGAQNGGQHHRVGMVGLSTSDRVPFAVARHGERVDRIHRSAGAA